MTQADRNDPRARVYCTYFDAAYAARARVLVESLRAVGETAPVVVCCFDEVARTAVRTWGLSDVIAVGVDDLVALQRGLRDVRRERTRAEFMFTCTPWVTALAMSMVDPGHWVVYLDADLAFFSTPDDVFAELAGADVGIVAHGYPPKRRQLERFGIFNVGWVSFRNTVEGRRVLDWWGRSCLEWCHDRVSDGRFADQGYLDRFPALSPAVRIITHPGANLAPWNIDTRPITTASDGSVQVAGRPLVFVHFHGLRRLGNRYVAMHIPFGTRANQVARSRVYAPYVAALSRAERAHPAVAVAPAARGAGLRGAMSRLRRRAYYARSVLRGESWRDCGA